MSEEERRPCKLMALVAELCLTLHEEPVNKHPGCWEQQIDRHWWIALNGHNAPVECSRGVAVLPFRCYVEYNGWPAGMFNTFGDGLIAAGEAANEDTLIAALEKRTRRLKWEVT